MSDISADRAIYTGSGTLKGRGELVPCVQPVDLHVVVNVHGAIDLQTVLSLQRECGQKSSSMNRDRNFPDHTAQSGLLARLLI